MKALTRTVGLVVGLGLVTSAEAKALDVAGHVVNYCLNLGGLNACASATITVSGSTLTAIVKNVSGAEGDIVIGRLTQFGFFYLDTAPTGGTATLNAGLSNPSDWVQLTSTSHLVTSLNGKPWLGHVGSFIGGAKAGVEWADVSLATGLHGTFVFNLGGVTDWSKVHFAWLGRGVDGRSVEVAKCYEGIDITRTLSKGECAAIRADDPDPVPVPEPASMTLIALGLVAMGGAGVIRRRRATK